MKKDIVRYALGLAAFGGLASAWACFSNTTGTPGATSTGTDTGNNTASSSSTGGGGASSSSAGGTSAASSSQATVVTSCPVGSTGPLGPVLDDMTSTAPDGAGLSGGSWYTYDDRTVPNSEPPQVVTGAPGTVTPAEGDSFPATATGPNIDPTSGAILASGGMATVAREGMGGGEMTWGAGFGLDLMGEQPDGGSVPLNACEAGAIFDTNPMPDSGKYTGIPLPFDAVSQGYTGFQFYGMSKTTTQAVDVHVGDQRTILWAGQCSVCQPSTVKCTLGGGLSSCPCNDDFVETVTFTTSWKHFTVKWKDSQVKAACFKPAGWSNEVADKIITVGSADAGIESNAIYNIHLQFNTSAGKALAPFDVLVAYFTWTTD